MKLKQILSLLNQVDKAKFITTLDTLCSQAVEENSKLKKFREDISSNLKDAGGNEITNLFNLVEKGFEQHIAETLSLSEPQIKLITDIIARDGNSFLRTSWLEQLYDREWKALSKGSAAVLKSFKEMAEEEKEEFGPVRRQQIYHNCFKIAFSNDQRSNRQERISEDERLVLNCLMDELSLSHDETSAIEHHVNPVKQGRIDEALQTLREAGIIFIDRRNAEIYVADEIVDLLHKVRGKDLPNKFMRRILRSLSDGELSTILKRYGDPIRVVVRADRINHIIHKNISAKIILGRDMHPKGSGLSARKDRLKSLIEDMSLDVEKLGTTLEERIDIILAAFHQSSDAEMSFLHAASYKEMLFKVNDVFEQDLKTLIFNEFEIETNLELSVELLKALSITPMDILFIMSNDEIRAIRDTLALSKRGDPRLRILESFVDTNDQMLEYYPAIACRDYATLKTANIAINESEIGVKFEEITKTIFEELGLNVDEELRKTVNTSKDKADIIISLSEDDIIVVEAKTHKNGDYSKYSSTSRQIKSYVQRYEKAGKRVTQALIIAPSFSEDFVDAAAMDTDINISMLEAAGLKAILDAFKSRRNPKFHGRLLTKGGLLMAERIAKQL